MDGLSLSIATYSCYCRGKMTTDSELTAVCVYACMLTSYYSEHAKVIQAKTDEDQVSSPPPPPRKLSGGRSSSSSWKKNTRPALSQFQSLAIRRSANCFSFRNIVRQILKLLSCERVAAARSPLPFLPSGHSLVVFKYWTQNKTS